MLDTKLIEAAAERFNAYPGASLNIRGQDVVAFAHAIEGIVSVQGTPPVSDSVWAVVRACHGPAHAAGWWKSGDVDLAHEARISSPYGAAIVAQKLMLIVSEVAEAMEGHRKNLMDDKLPHRKMIEVELADALIRVADLAGALGLDLGGATEEKLAYNAQRADHKPEARAAAGGKTY